MADTTFAAVEEALPELMVGTDETEDDTPLEIAPDKRRVKTDKLDTPVETLHAWVRAAS